MKIAINTRFLLPNGLEGIGIYTHELSQRLVQLFPEHTFYFIFDRPFDKKYIYGKNVIPLVVSPPARHPLLWYIWFEKMIPVALKKQGIDLFISMDGYCSLKTKVRTLMVIHDLAYLHYPHQIPWLARKYYEKYVPKYCHRADQLLTISNATREDISNNFNIPAKTIGIVPNGYNPNFYPVSESDKKSTRLKYASGQPYFCCLGAIHPRKNIEGTIRAFEAYKEKSKGKDKLLIIGRMAWKTNSVLDLANRSLYKSDIHFLGYLPDEEVHQVLSAAKALLFLSLFEGFGRPLLECMQLNVPSIYSNCSVMPEVAGGTGIAVNPNDQAEIAKAMINIADFNTPAVAELRKERLAKYSWERAAQILAGFIPQA